MSADMLEIDWLAELTGSSDEMLGRFYATHRFQKLLL
jgi:hypothetical protein